MSYVSLERLLKKQDSSIFKLTLAAAARANELVQGAQPLIKTASKKVSTIALEEIATGAIRYEAIKTKSKKAEL